MKDRFDHFTLAIFNISRYWNKIATEEMKRHDLKGAYAMYLSVLSGSGEITAATLAELCARDKADVSRAVAAFMERGMVERAGGNNYRAPLRLTEKGHAIADQINERASLALEIAGQGISPEERQTMYDCLDRISGNLKELSQEGLPEGKD